MAILVMMSPGGLQAPAMDQGFWRLVAQYRVTLVGGARFRQVTGRNLFEVYGITEASGLISFDPFAGAGAGQRGRATRHASERVAA